MTYFLHYLLFSFIYFTYFFPIWEKQTKGKLTLHLLMLSYLLVVLSITVIPLPVDLQFTNHNLLQSINFLPFRDIIHGYTFAKTEMLLNILMMIPYGILVPLVTNQKCFLTVISTLLFSTTIESTQLLTILFYSDFPRIVDITDILTNTTGGLGGYIIFYLWKLR